jgi:hypothetical protein
VIATRFVMNGEGRADDDAMAIALERVRQALAGLHYGSVTVTVHDGVVVQVERSEKIRFEKGKKV